MLRQIVNLLAPRAVEMLLERASAGQEPAPRAAEGPLPDLEARIQALHRQAEAAAAAHRTHVEEMAQAVRAIGWRSTAALWLSIASMLISLVGMAWLLLR